MNRRDFIRLSLLGAGVSLTSNLFAGRVGGDYYKNAFDKALAQNPWLIGWQGTQSEVLKANNLSVIGRIPKNLSGVLYRNGAAKNEVFSQRYQHWFDGDGMVQSFRFNQGKASHLGRLVGTQKYQKEKQAKQKLFDAFGTKGSQQITSADQINPANISVMPVGDELFATWEGGSFYQINPKTLETIGIKSYSPKTKGLPLGAHYKKDADSSIWNIGYGSLNNVILIWHFDKNNQLLSLKPIPINPVPMVHDFLITQDYIILVLPPYTFNKAKFRVGTTFLASHEFDAKQATKVWVLDKNTQTIKHRFELPSQFTFHFINAWQVGKEILFDSMRYDNVDILDDFSQVMQGVLPNIDHAKVFRTTLNLITGVATEQLLNNIGSEFPSIEEAKTGQFNSEFVCLQQHGNSRLLNSVALVDTQSGNSQHYQYNNQIPEEHLLLKQGKNAWVIGTSLDVVNKHTNINIFNAKSLSDGPIAIAKLPYVLPLGLHGKFVSN